MDRYLVRGRTPQNGTWVVGLLFDIYEDKTATIRCLIQDSGIEVEATSIGQCTGLKDKNGKLIFEGDILQKHHYKGIVKFGEYHRARLVNGQREYPNGDIGFYIEWHSDTKNHYMRNDILFWVKHEGVGVIGNIHDNHRNPPCEHLKSSRAYPHIRLDNARQRQRRGRSTN